MRPASSSSVRDGEDAPWLRGERVCQRARVTRAVGERAEDQPHFRRIAGLRGRDPPASAARHRGQRVAAARPTRRSVGLAPAWRRRGSARCTRPLSAARRRPGRPAPGSPPRPRARRCSGAPLARRRLDDDHRVGQRGDHGVASQELPWLGGDCRARTARRRPLAPATIPRPQIAVPRRKEVVVARPPARRSSARRRQARPHRGRRRRSRAPDLETMHSARFAPAPPRGAGRGGGPGRTGHASRPRQRTAPAARRARRRPRGPPEARPQALAAQLVELGPGDPATLPGGPWAGRRGCTTVLHAGRPGGKRRATSKDSRCHPP